MKLTSPSDMEPSVEETEVALSAFEKEFEKQPRGLKYYHLVIAGELNKPTCDAVAKEYQKLGWIAKCRTSSENGERAGLTGLILELK